LSRRDLSFRDGAVTWRELEQPLTFEQLLEIERWLGDAVGDMAKAIRGRLDKQLNRLAEESTRYSHSGWVLAAEAKPKEPT
jgi:hypothetical protein